MKTKHIIVNGSGPSSANLLSSSIISALHEVQAPAYLRIITCGKGVVILPDTDRTKDCEAPEMIKALGLKKHASVAEESRLNILCLRDNEVEAVYSLTPDQQNLLEELTKKDLLWDCVQFYPIHEAKKI
jgi:hypothetical protein